MIHPQRASLVHPGEGKCVASGRQQIGKSAVGRYTDRMGQGFCTGWEKAPGAAMVEERKKRASGNAEDQGNRTVERSRSADRMLRHPQRRTGRRSETGDEGEESSGEGRMVGRWMKLMSAAHFISPAATSGKRKLRRSDLNNESGVG